MKTKPKIELRIAMLRAGLTRHDLARKTGMGLQTVSGVMYEGAGNSGPTQRWRVEKAIGAPFWTASEEFARRMAIIKTIGFDPWLSTRAKLVRKCQAAGLLKHDPRQVGNYIHFEDLISILAKHHGRAAA